MKTLIALVTVVALVEGVRTEFPPGSMLPELSPHDEDELKKMGSIEDPAETAKSESAAARAEAKSSGDFEREKKAITAAQASTAPAAKTATKR